MSDAAVDDRPVEICALRPDLQDEVRSLILDGLREHWGAIDPELNRDLDDLAASYPHGETMVACNQGTVVGTGTLARRDDVTAEIVRMSVAPAWRRSGLGRRLADALIDTARSWGMSRVVLETSADWTEVVEFYVRCGFVLTHFARGEFGSDVWFEVNLES